MLQCEQLGEVALDVHWSVEKLCAMFRWPLLLDEAVHRPINGAYGSG
jgi:hypothetical protein